MRVLWPLSIVPGLVAFACSSGQTAPAGGVGGDGAGTSWSSSSGASTSTSSSTSTSTSTSSSSSTSGGGGASTSSSGSGGSSTTSSGGGSGTGGGAQGPIGVDPSKGSGGTIPPGGTGASPLGATIRIPTSYDGAAFASPVVWLMNEQIPWWSAIADADRVILVDLAEYNDINKIVAKLNETQTILETQYDVDKARYYWAGWSAGGNIAVIVGSQNQDTLAGTLVFPGTGGGIAQPYMQSNQGHKLRLFYACGDMDPNYSWSVVENEAATWQGYGYTTQFVKVPGAPHYLDEATYGVRAQGWAWIKGFTLKN